MIALTSPVETPAHHWPAGLKLAALCIVTLILFAVEGLLAHLAFLAATALLFLWAGWRFARAGLVPLWQLWPFVVLILLWHLLAGETAEGVEIVLRMLTAVALATFCGLYVVPLNAVYLDAAPPEERGRFVACSNITDSAAMVEQGQSTLKVLMTGRTTVSSLLTIITGTRRAQQGSAQA